jgi:drug/metabolite transporter (DMT)-like permease
MDISQQPHRGERSSTGAGFAAIILWATTIAVGRSVTEQIGPLTTGALVYLVGGLLGSVYLLARGRFLFTFRTLSKRYLIGCGSLFVLNMLGMYLAIGLAADRAQVLEVGLVNYLWPMLTMVASVVLLRLRATVFLIPGALAATAGIFLTVTQSSSVTWESFQRNVADNQVAYGAALMAAITWALYSVLSRKWAANDEGEAVPIFMLATGVILGVARLLHPEEARWTISCVADLAYLATGPNLAYFLWEHAMRKGDIVLVTSASYFTPFLSTLISCAYLGVTAGMQLWAGCGLIIAGAAICKWAVREDEDRGGLGGSVEMA